MKLYRLITALIFATLISACGGGGSTTSSGSSVNTSGKTEITGTAAHGLIRKGTVKVYLLTGGARLLLATTTTDDNGRYSASVTSQTQPILIEITGGTYIDEATGSTVPNTAPVRAAVTSATGSSLQVAVTALTELAVQLAGSTPTSATIASANSQVTDLFNVDIIGTQPVEPTLQVFQSSTTAQKDYTLALAGISQLAKETTNGSIPAVVDAYRSEIAAGDTLSSQTATIFKNKVTAFLGSTRNQTGTPSITTALASIGTITYPIALNVKGTFAAGSFIEGLQLKLKLPTGVTVQNQAGVPVTGAITASGSAANTSTVQYNYSPADGIVSVGIINVEPGFGLGQFLTIICEVAPGAALDVSNFGITELTVVGAHGTPITGMTAYVTL